MARVNGPAAEIHRALGAAGVPLSASQVARAMADGLGPVGDCEDPISHWRALAQLRRGQSARLPEADFAALALAGSGHPCDRLRGTLLRLGPGGQVTTVDPLDEVRVATEGRNLEVETAFHLAGESDDSSELPYGASLALRFIKGSIASGPVWSERSRDPADVKLEHLGRAQAAMDSLAERLDGAPSKEIDASDLAAVTNYPEESVIATTRVFDAVFGSDWTNGGVPLVESADLETLTAVVRAAEALLPVFEKKMVPLRSESIRWQIVAVCVPVILAMTRFVTSGDDTLRGLSELTSLFQTTAAQLERSGPLGLGPIQSANRPTQIT